LARRELGLVELGLGELELAELVDLQRMGIFSEVLPKVIFLGSIVQVVLKSPWSPSCRTH
jgi:hypothetical protein